jgi:hypothetical protein
MIADSRATKTLLERYDLHVAKSKTIDGAALIALYAFEDDPVGSVIRIESGSHTATRMCPVDRFQAESMLSALRSPHGPAYEPHIVRMLAHTIARVSHLFLENDLTSLRITIAVGENRLEIVKAVIESSRPLHPRPRLTPHAHDRKDSYRPSGAQ